MTKPQLTLNDIKTKATASGGQKSFGVSDFLSKDELRELRRANYAGKAPKRLFNGVDAYIAEIIARFGYDAYKDWQEGILPDQKMRKMIYAERARERSNLLGIEAIIISMVGACVRRQKGQPAPKGPKTAIKIFKREAKDARGEQ